MYLIGFCGIASKEVKQNVGVAALMGVGVDLILLEVMAGLMFALLGSCCSRCIKCIGVPFHMYRQLRNGK